MRSLIPSSFRSSLRGLGAAAALAACVWPAQAVPVAFVELTGVTGGSPAATAVFKADLSSVGISSLLSVSITDSNSGLGGASGQFSGFDLDAIVLSTTDCASAACAAGLVGLSLFDFIAGTVFTPGAQRAPADPQLFGTGAGGASVDDAVATLGAFDGDSTTVTPDGFLSMGDGGRVDFNLTAAVSTAGLFLYIGEVGDNGELAASSVIVRSTRTVAEPSSAALAGLATMGTLLPLASAGLRRRRDRVFA
jgi:hypothetical protein